jgi:hypothetical protein
VGCIVRRETSQTARRIFSPGSGHSDERKDAGPARLVHGPGSGETLSDLIEDTEFDGPVFDKAALYDYGAGDRVLSLPSILVRIPQIVEYPAQFAFQYGERKREAL